MAVSAAAIAVAQAAMLGDLAPAGGKVILIVKGEAQVKSDDSNLIIRKE